MIVHSKLPHLNVLMAHKNCGKWEQHGFQITFLSLVLSSSYTVLFVCTYTRIKALLSAAAQEFDEFLFFQFAEHKYLGQFYCKSGQVNMLFLLCQAFNAGLEWIVLFQNSMMHFNAQ